jgi:hypothetical protein
MQSELESEQNGKNKKKNLIGEFFLYSNVQNLYYHDCLPEAMARKPKKISAQEVMKVAKAEVGSSTQQASVESASLPDPGHAPAHRT